MLKILKTPEGKSFLLLWLVCLSLRYAWCQKPHSRAWKTSTICRWILGHILFIIQGAWVAIYSFMFTIVGALPFGFYFLGPKDDSE
jgi:hypothetical protein